MRNKILKSVFTIGAVLAMTGVTYTQAAFTDAVYIQDNTFVTGNAELKLFYDCYLNPSGANTPQLTRTFGAVPTGTGAYVECPANDNLVAAGLNGMAADGAWEQASLLYAGGTNWFGVPTNNDGATVAGTEFFNNELTPATRWLPSNGWYDALTSPQDWTNVYPGWSTYADNTGTIEGLNAVIAMNEGDFLSVGNGGTVPLTSILATATVEANGAGELEPLDGQLDAAPVDGVGETFVGGGDRIDPLSDAGWTGYSKLYDANLANQIYVRVDRMNATGAVEATVYQGLLTGLAGADLLAGSNGLDADEVVVLRFNWEMDSDADNTFENTRFDYRIDFTGST